MNLAGNPRSLVSFETPALAYLGRISYGLYMYHPVAIVFVLRCLMWIGHADAHVFVVFALCSIAAIILAAISYELFERRILRWKETFARVPSGAPLSGQSVQPAIGLPRHFCLEASEPCPSPPVDCSTATSATRINRP